MTIDPAQPDRAIGERGIQIGGRGQWRIEDVELEGYISRQYEQADATRVDDDVTSDR